MANWSIHEIVELGDTAYARTSSEGQAEVLAGNAKLSGACNEVFIFRKEKGWWKSTATFSIDPPWPAQRLSA